jgi:hypothetical protein
VQRVQALPRTRCLSPQGPSIFAFVVFPGPWEEGQVGQLRWSGCHQEAQGLSRKTALYLWQLLGNKWVAGSEEKEKVPS